MKLSGIGTWTRRRSVLSVAAAATVVAATLAAALIFSGSHDGGSPSAAGSTSSTSSGSSASPVRLEPAPTTPVPRGSNIDLNKAPASLAAVALQQAVHVGGVTAQVARLEAINGTGTGRGNVSGPALRATIRITNGTEAPVSLDGVAVALTHGSKALPASPLDDPSAAPFQGTLNAGSSADGVYVFSVPANDRSVITVAVGYQAGAPFMVFTGSAR